MTKFVGMNASFKIKKEDKYFRMAKTVGAHVIESKASHGFGLNISRETFNK